MQSTSSAPPFASAAVPLTQNPNFRRFWWGQAASNLGDAFGFVAMPLLVLEASHSVAQMGVVTALTGAGQLAAATFSGVLVDRSHRRRLMIACDLLRLALYGALPVLAALGRLGMPVIYAVALLTAMASNVFLVCYMAAVRNLVEPEQVAAANGRLQATQALTYVLGSALAGAISARWGAAWAMGGNALSFALSALTLANLGFRRDRAERDPNEPLRPLGELWTGLSFLIKSRTLGALTLFQTGVALLSSIGIGAAVIDLIVYRLKVDLHESSGTVGACLALASVGAVVGALAAGRREKKLGLSMIIGTALQGVGLVFGGLGHSAVLITACGMLWSGGLTFRAVGGASLRQTLTPDALLGRVLAAGWALIFAASSLGAVWVTRLGALVGTGTAMVAIGVLLLVLCAGGLLSPLARAERG